MASQSRKTDRTTYLKRLLNKEYKIVASLRKEYEKLDDIKRYIHSEVLLHQSTALEDDELDNVISIKGDCKLNQSHLQTLEKYLECTKKATCLNFSQVILNVEAIEGFEENLNADQSMVSPTASTGVIEKGIIKTVRATGNINNLIFKVECLTKQELDSQEGRLESVHVLDVSPINDNVRMMLKSSDDPDVTTRILNNVHYLQMLEEERLSTIRYLEESVPDLIISPEQEPLKIEYFPIQDASFKLYWTIKYDAKNIRLKNEIFFKCPDELLAYFKPSEAIYPYLSGKETLQTSDDVINIFDIFIED